MILIQQNVQNKLSLQTICLYPNPKSFSSFAPLSFWYWLELWSLKPHFAHNHNLCKHQSLSIITEYYKKQPLSTVVINCILPLKHWWGVMIWFCYDIAPKITFLYFLSSWFISPVGLQSSLIRSESGIMTWSALYALLKLHTLFSTLHHQLTCII